MERYLAPDFLVLFAIAIVSLLGIIFGIGVTKVDHGATFSTIVLILVCTPTLILSTIAILAFHVFIDD